MSRFEQLRAGMRRAPVTGVDLAGSSSVGPEYGGGADRDAGSPDHHDPAGEGGNPDHHDPAGEDATETGSAADEATGSTIDSVGDRSDAGVGDRPDVGYPGRKTPTEAPARVNGRDNAEVPHGLRIAAAWSWRLLILAVVAAGVLWLVGRLSTVLIPLSIALLLSALLTPMVGFLRRRFRLPRSMAAAVVLIGGIAAVAGTLTLVVTQFVNGFPTLSDKAAAGVETIQKWLRTGPAHLSTRQIDDALAAAQNWFQDNRAMLAGGAVNTAAATLEALAAMFLVLFATFFFLRDGQRIWRFLTGLLPSAIRDPVADAGQAAWGTLVSYVRATVLVAFIDAVGIGLALVILRVGFAFPLAALVFLAAFVPIVGATVSGAVAVLVALVVRGPLIALLVLVAVITIQQLEGHVLQPLIMGRAVAIHPLAVIVAIATGAVLAGIIGAFVAVPIVAVLNTGVRHLAGYRNGGPPGRVTAGDPAG